LAPSRRACLASVAATLVAPGAAFAAAPKPGAPAAAKTPPGPKGKLRKALKYGMIKEGKTVAERFALARDCGFEGVELDSPMEIDRKEVVAASRKTGLVIHGVVDSIHWKQRLSDPDAEIRAKGLEGLLGALADARLYGASTVLLVPGRVTDPEKESFDQVWQRSQAEVKKALPIARKLGVKIAIEVVWNDFITTPEQLVKYVDELADPMLGAYFDVSNMLKYGVPAAKWIRELGPRMLKFDFKGYSHTKKWVDIGDGDEDWADVRKALGEVNYAAAMGGWATSEVKGGGKKELLDISARMDRVLGLG
jgi:hexulose-6-phosphate isomerase